MPDYSADGLIVFLVGASVGVGELVARYRDEPRRAILTRPAMLYVAINGLASVFALVAILTFGWTSDPKASAEAQRLLRILLAGFGAMAVFRTSLFVVRVGTNDVGVGPVAFLQILLGATDRGVDRKRASERAEKVVRIMGDLDPALAYNALPAFAIMLMQNLTLEDQKAIGDQVKALAQPESNIPEQAKVLNVGLLLMNFVGEEVLEDAVRGIRGQLKPSGFHLPVIGGRPNGGSDGQLPGTDGQAHEGSADKEESKPSGVPADSAISQATDADLGRVEPEVPPNTDLPVAAGSLPLDTASGTPGAPVGEPPPAGKSAPGTALPPP
jgi:hypothetical protein